MANYGNDKEGFSVDSERGKTRIKAWGFWSAEFSAQFASCVLRELPQGKSPAALEIDVSQLRPLRDEGQTAFGSLLEQSFLRGVSQVTIVSPSAITRLQMMRLARQASKPDQVKVE